VRSNTGTTLLHNGFNRFSYNILFSAHLKHSSFWHSADFKSILNILVHAIYALAVHSCSSSLCLSLASVAGISQTADVVVAVKAAKAAKPVEPARVARAAGAAWGTGGGRHGCGS
jgi:hypothetical protein